MKKMTALALAISLSLGVTAASFAESKGDVVITTGGTSGTYYRVFGAGLAKYFKAYGYNPSVVTSKGSVENLDRIAAGEATIGFTQADAYKWWLTKGKDTSGVTEIVGTLGKECVFIAVNSDGKVKDEGDLQNKKIGAHIAVQSIGSGTAVTWDYMTQLESGYKASTTEYLSDMRALGQLAAGKMDAVMWVTAPGNLDHKYLTAINNNKNLRLIDVNDYDLNDKLPNGQAVYTFEKIVVKKGTFTDDKVTTICTDVLVVANNSANEDVLNTAADILINNINGIVKAKE